MPRWKKSEVRSLKLHKKDGEDLFHAVRESSTSIKVPQSIPFIPLLIVGDREKSEKAVLALCRERGKVAIVFLA